MPTYEYRCESCGRTVEVFQGFSDAPLTTCDGCSGVLHKVYAPVGIVFKGSGFYKTDSRSSASKSASRTSSESGGDAAPAATGVESKKEPAAATASPAPTPAKAEASAAPTTSKGSAPRD